MLKCKLCEEEKEDLKATKDGYLFCSDCIREICKAFTYSVDGKEVSKETHDKIAQRGYVIPEELDKERANEI